MKLKRTRWPAVYESPGGRYKAVASVGGKKTWRTFDTATEARRWKARYEDDEDKRGSDPTTADVLGRWMAAHERDWRPNTKAARSSVFRIHIEQTIGERRVSELLADREHIRSLYRSVSPAVARNIHEALRGAFRWARLEGIVDTDPIELVRPPRYQRTEARYLDLEDVRRLRDLAAGPHELGHEFLEGASILGLAGLRAGESVAVRWGDLAGRTLHVRRSHWGKTKTGRVRSLTLPAGDLAALRAFRNRERERLFAVGVRLDEETTILTDGIGEPMTPKYLGQTFTIWARKHGLDCTYHSLRHTAASLMLASGIDVRTVAGRLGHASATTTLAIYSHMIRQADVDAADRIEALISGAPG